MKNKIKEAFGILRSRSGFSLVELMIVVAILGMLAAAVGIYINTGKSELKTFVFNQKAKFHLARFEATKRGRNVYVDFDFLPVVTNGDGNIENGYSVWVDDNRDANYTAWNDPFVDANGNGNCDLEAGGNPGEGDCDGDNVCDTGEGDCLLSTVVFQNIINTTQHGPEIYDPATGGGVPPDINGGPNGTDIGIGITADSNGPTAPNPNGKFRFSPNGNSIAGTVYFYLPQGPAAGKTAAHGPWAIIVNNVGRITVSFYNQAGSRWE